jgi:hypothetical protein
MPLPGMVLAPLIFVTLRKNSLLFLPLAAAAEGGKLSEGRSVSDWIFLFHVSSL